jgi:hypothetical protein
MTNGNDAPTPPDEIARLVYALYDTSPEEIAIVEAATK